MRPSIKQNLNDNGGGNMDLELEYHMVIFFKFVKMEKLINIIAKFC